MHRGVPVAGLMLLALALTLWTASPVETLFATLTLAAAATFITVTTTPRRAPVRMRRSSSTPRAPRRRPAR